MYTVKSYTTLDHDPSVPPLVGSHLSQIFKMAKTPTVPVTHSPCCLCGAKAFAPTKHAAEHNQKQYCVDCYPLSVEHGGRKPSRFSMTHTACLMELDDADNIIKTSVLTSDDMVQQSNISTVTVEFHGAENHLSSKKYNNINRLREIIFNPPNGEYIFSIFGEKDANFTFHRSNRDVLYICGNKFEYCDAHPKSSRYGTLPYIQNGNKVVLQSIPIMRVRMIVDELQRNNLLDLLPYEWDYILSFNSSSFTPNEGQKKIFAEITKRYPQLNGWYYNSFAIPLPLTAEHIAIREFLRNRNWSLDKKAYKSEIRGQK